jgi:hypothetical protein
MQQRVVTNTAREQNMHGVYKNLKGGASRKGIQVDNV